MSNLKELKEMVDLVNPMKSETMRAFSLVDGKLEEYLLSYKTGEPIILREIEQAFPFEIIVHTQFALLTYTVDKGSYGGFIPVSLYSIYDNTVEGDGKLPLYYYDMQTGRLR